MPGRTELVQGTLELLILKVLALEPTHGYGICQRLDQVSRGVFQVNAGSMFPALHRMETKGWVAGEWSRTENNRRAKYYRLTRKGRRRLTTETVQWERASLAITHVLETG